MSTRPQKKARRAALGGLCATLLAAVFAGGPGASGCAAPFDPPGLVNTVRILAVGADEPFGKPGEAVTFKMTYVDGRRLDNFVPVNIVWLGGCFNPPGQAYYGCYEPLAEIFAKLEAGEIDPNGYIAGGPGVDSFELTLPDDIVSSAPEPEYGPKYGLAFVFFLACAGEVRPVIQEGDTEAGFFPLGCFDSDGRELGPDAFIPGYTQIYAFEDGRENDNPEVVGMIFDGETRAEGDTLEVGACPVTLEERRKTGCSATDEFTECEVYDVDVEVPDSIAEEDPESKDAEGNVLNEVVWVSYFATGGSFDGETKLIADATTGLIEDRGVQWVPPEETGSYQIWAVIRDNRGGSDVVTHFVTVTE